MAPGGQLLKNVEPLGGVFAPVPGKMLRPAWTYGPAQGNARSRAVLFQCPVSAIPELAFDMLELWFDCRRMHVLPFAGGWLDQPLVVRRSFPVFEAEWQAVESQRQAAAPQEAAAAAVGAVVAAQRRPAR